MKKLKIRMINLSVTLALLLISCFEMGYSNPQSHHYFIEKDAIGRLIVLWADSNTNSLFISIDEGKPKEISLPGQICLNPTLDWTEEGDLVVIWAGKVPNKETYSLYGTRLPFGGNWTLPEMIPEPDELVVLTSPRLVVKHSDEIRVFWESVTYFPSTANPDQLESHKELRSTTGSIKSWGSPKTTTFMHGQK